MFHCNTILQMYIRKSWLWSRLFWEKCLNKTYFYFTANPIRDTYKTFIKRDIGSICENNWRDFNKKWEWICFCWKQCQIGYWSFLCEQLVEISTRNGSGSFLLIADCLLYLGKGNPFRIKPQSAGILGFYTFSSIYENLTLVQYMNCFFKPLRQEQIFFHPISSFEPRSKKFPPMSCFEFTTISYVPFQFGLIFGWNQETKQT